MIPPVAMNRHAWDALLTNALEEQLAVLLTGMPRVGRTFLIDRFCNERAEEVLLLNASKKLDREKLESLVDTIEDLEKVVVVEEIDERSIDIIAILVRSVKINKSVKFILLPRYQWVVARLLPMLVGLARMLELPPIQLDEASASIELSIITNDGSLIPKHYPTQSEQSPSQRQAIHWLRGGFPSSLYADSDRQSFIWRRDYLATLLDGSFEQWDIELADGIGEIFSRLVRGHGRQFDEDKCRSELKLDKSKFNRVIKALRNIGLVRRLDNWKEGGLAVMYVRDSGLLHAAAALETSKQLRESDHFYGHSWESFAAESLIIACADMADPYFYRDKDGNEIDLVLDFRSGSKELIAIEFKVNEDESVRAGFWRACEDLRPTQKLLVHSGTLVNDTNYLSSLTLMAAIKKIRNVVDSRFLSN